MSSDSTSVEFLDRIQKLSPKRLALLAVELERRLAARETSVSGPIAVTGLACRIPGGIDTPDEFWELLARGGDAIEEVPSNRWNGEAFYDPLPGTPGKANTKWGGFVSRIDQFDPAFFGIAPREAIGMDPQQRMLLEVSWEALENAGERAELLNGSQTGVFLGMSTNDYASLLSLHDETLFDAYSGSGIARSVAAGRLSYFLGLKGPNMAIDTACSSSAVAIHLACQSLRTNECRLALAGGVNALLVPQVTIALAQARMLASDGRCKTFSQLADGFVRSEGCGMLVLKRLADAQADGDRILGVVRGSAINHDGRSSGLTAPNGLSQEAVVKAALNQAGLRPEDVDYIEAHGTGTVLGDAIELGALGECFGAEHDTRAPLLIGSVKTNIGHLEAAAGVSGVIKVLLALQHGSLPAHLHVTEDRENDALRKLPLKIPLSATPWPVTKRPRVAGISSFGFSGTNAHIIIEEAPPAQSESGNSDLAQIITVSAKSVDALSTLCARHAEYLQQHAQTSLADFAFTLNTGRSHFQHRIALLVGSVKEAADQLQQIAGQGVEGHPAYRFITGYEAPSVGFLFTGQGSQYAGMGRALYTHNTVFRSAVDHCDDILKGKLTHKLSAVLCGEESVPADLIHETQWTQPALFAFEYALALVWRSWGVRPSVVLGHSLGEYVAACIAEVFAVEAALTLAYERGRLMAGLPRGGAMLAVRASEEEVAETLHQFSQVGLAAVNGPRSVVVSGVSEQIERLRDLLAGRGVVSQLLTVSHAFHSTLMEPILDEFERQAAKLTYEEPAIRMVSNVSGNAFTARERMDASYWRKHIRSTVRFAEGFASLMAERPAALLEVGPDPVLLGMAKPVLAHSSVSCLPSLRRGKDAWQSLHEAVRQFYLLGVPIEWDRLYSDQPARKLALPTYPFQRQRYWVEIPKVAASKEIKSGSLPSMPFDPLLYTTEWQVEEDSAGASLPPAPERLLQAAAMTIEATSRNRDSHQAIAAYDDFLPQLDHLCSAYILKALRELGLDLRDGLHLSHVKLDAELGIKPEHHRLVERLFSILEEDGIVDRAEGSWVFRRIPSTDPAMEQARLSAKFPQFAAELNFLGQTSNLSSVLQGRLSAVEVLFPNGSFKLAEQVYQESVAARMFNRAVGETVCRAVDAYASDRVVKVVEVGAGTGSTTSQILPLLQGKRVEYLFTDLSPAFFGSARTKFAKFPFLQYATLDIEEDNGSAEVADIVIAANVLHATANLARTLGRLRRMLRPGGSLIVLEGTSPQRFGDLTVGMTEGWWRYSDAPRRQTYPLMTRRQWLDLFSETRFRAAALEEDGPVETLTRQQTILVAQPYQAIADQSESSVLFLGESPESDALSFALKSAHFDVHRLENYGAQVAAATPLGQVKTRRELLRNWLGKKTKQTPVLIDLAEPHKGQLAPESVLKSAAELLDLFQAIIEDGPHHDAIWLVTRGSASIGDEGPVNLSSSFADAMAKTVRLEHPELPVRWVDLPLNAEERDFARLGRLMREGTREYSLAIRKGELVVPRLVALSAVSSRNDKPLKFIPGAAYLVTGAYGGLGFRTVQWMVDRGATCIFMVGRHAPLPDVHDRIIKLKERGVTIYDLIADVSERRDVETIFSNISESGVDLKGIVHAAGALDDGTVLQQTHKKFSKVFAAKVHGSWLLHEFSRKSPLDFFVLFGSAASVLGSAGQINHAAANGFLDALSHLRQREGLPSISVAWGAWSEIGAATRIKDTGRSTRLGLGTFSPDKGIELLEQAIGSGLSEVAALPVDWQVYCASGQTQRDWPLFEKLFMPVAKEQPSRGPNADLKALLKDSPPENRLKIIKEYQRARILDVLGLDSSFTLRDDQPLAELGLDSLMALELKNELQTTMGVTLPPNFFFEYPTLVLSSTCLDAMLVAAPGGVRPGLDSSEYEELAL